MNKEQLEADYKNYLDTLPIVTLRVLGRHLGVAQVCATNKVSLVDGILDVLMERVEPITHSRRGAPPKQTYLDPAIPDKLDEIKHKHCSRGFGFGVASPEYRETVFAGDQVLYSGILELTPAGYGFLRAKNCQPSGGGLDVFVPAPVVHSLKLRQGDFVTCTVTPRLKNDSPAFDVLGTVNGRLAGRYEDRPLFDNLTAQYANEKIALSKGNGELSLRLLDLFIPIGKGQRGLIIAPPKAGKTTLLKNMARSPNSTARSNSSFCSSTSVPKRSPTSVRAFPRQKLCIRRSTRGRNGMSAPQL